MNVEQIMSTDLSTCSPHDTLDCAAQIMWERDCGVVPVIDSSERVIGMVSDRDICMAAYTQGKRLYQIPVSSVAAKPIAHVAPHDSVQTAEAVMRKHQVRRVVVLNEDGRLVGLLSINDLARRAGRHDLSSAEVTKTLAAICQPRLSERLATSA